MRGPHVALYDAVRAAVHASAQAAEGAATLPASLAGVGPDEREDLGRYVHPAISGRSCPGVVVVPTGATRPRGRRFLHCRPHCRVRDQRSSDTRPPRVSGSCHTSHNELVAADQHTAAGQALGYVYQVGRALLELARPGPEDQELRLESIDDVSWHDAAGNPLQALQVKHHLGVGGTLGDMSADLWRTIQVWLDNPALQQPDGPSLYLITTQSVTDTSALARLGTQDRDPGSALHLLNAAASESTNKSTARARTAWLSQPLATRTGIVSRITAVWRQATAQELTAELRQVLDVGLPVGQEDSFLELLLGWWWRVSVDLLAGARTGVTRLHLRLKLDDLRDQFSSRNLPMTVGADGLPDSLEGHRDRIFAHQLDWVEAGDDLLLIAVRDYYRAYSQSQDWVENNMIELAELAAYEQRVIDEWKMQFALIRRSLGSSPTEEDLKDAGMRLYSVAMNQPASMLRPGLTDPFFARGTHHSLADAGTVGWHPDFAQRLEALLMTRLP